MGELTSIWHSIRVDWSITEAGDREKGISFTSFGVHFMQFLRDNAFQYEGAVVAKGGTIELDGQFSIPRRITGDDFHFMFTDFCESHFWSFGGVHRVGIGD